VPKPITITEEMKAKAFEEFAMFLDDLKMTDGKISYSKSFKYNDVTVTLCLTQLAYRKIVALVTSFSDEVAWHGTVSQESNDMFIIKDIYVYPQEVTGSTVNTDWNHYTEWLYSFEDDVFNTIRMQGHSHVNMGVSPSGVDDNHRAEILKQLDSDMFYIFMIWNKSLKTHTLIYDMSRNVLYENDDIDLKVLDDEVMDVFLTEANENVQKRKSKPKTYRVMRSEMKESSFQRSLWDDGYDDDLLGLNEYERMYRYGCT
jgi:hypothetical protein